MKLPTLRTERLILRPWRTSDLIPFAALNADPKVMEFYTHTLTWEESVTVAERIQREFAKRGYGFWAVEVPGIADFIGYIGLNDWNKKKEFAPCIDIGWRLSSSHWGKGYAVEGAMQVLRYGFEVLHFSEIVSMATMGNHRSIRLMQRLGMKTDPQENFEHPTLPKGHPLSWHVLYRLSSRNKFSQGSEIPLI